MVKGQIFKKSSKFWTLFPPETLCSFSHAFLILAKDFTIRKTNSFLRAKPFNNEIHGHILGIFLLGLLKAFKKKSFYQHPLLWSYWFFSKDLSMVSFLRHSGKIFCKLKSNNFPFTFCLLCQLFSSFPQTVTNTFIGLRSVHVELSSRFMDAPFSSLGYQTFFAHILFRFEMKESSSNIRGLFSNLWYKIWIQFPSHSGFLEALFSTRKNPPWSWAYFTFSIAKKRCKKREWFYRLAKNIFYKLLSSKSPTIWHP